MFEAKKYSPFYSVGVQFPEVVYFQKSVKPPKQIIIL